MDDVTVRAYDDRADRFAAFYRAIRLTRMDHLMSAFFRAGGKTVDIGCGSGRDTAWLCAQGFPAVGYDASLKMLGEARAAYPEACFEPANLPDLKAIPDEAYANVLCSATLMHLDKADLITAAMSLARILQPGGRLLVSVRGSRGEGEREPDGRLFTAIPSGKLALLLEAAGLQVLHKETASDPSRPETEWSMLALERNPEAASRGLERVQSVLVQDRKDATYKLALVRALCQISRTQPHLVRWGQERVLVPLWSIAVHWLRYYWPLLTGSGFIAQKRGERPDGLRPIAFRGEIRRLEARYGPGGLALALGDLDERPAEFARVFEEGCGDHSGWTGYLCRDGWPTDLRLYPPRTGGSGSA